MALLVPEAPVEAGTLQENPAGVGPRSFTADSSVPCISLVDHKVGLLPLLP